MLNKNIPLMLLSALALCSLFAAQTHAWQATPIPEAPQNPQTQTQPAPASPSAQGVVGTQSGSDGVSSQPVVRTGSGSDGVSPAELKDEATVASDESYRIGPGDILDISTSKQPDYSQQGVRVDDNGMIQIPRDDTEIRAACKTARELATEIKGRYQRYLRKPYVYVQVKEFLSQPVAVMGAVTTPGRFQLQRRIRLLEVLTLVNGPSPDAGATLQIVRKADGAMCDSPTEREAMTTDGKRIIYNLKNTMAAVPEANPYLRPGDIVYVPEADQAFIVGAIKTPAPIQLKEPITVSEAIARSGGLLPDANSEKVRITRQAPGSTKIELIANLKAISRRQQEDIVLQANDIIDVPGPSGAKKFLSELMKTVVPRMTSYPLGIVR